MAIAEISLVPIGTHDTTLSGYVAGVVDVLGKTGLSYQLTPMGTIIEGSLDDIFSAVKQMHEHVFETGVKRVYATVKIDDRRDRSVHMGDKVDSVQQKLQS